MPAVPDLSPPGLSLPGLTLIVGASGFLGRNLQAWFDRHGVAYATIGRDAGDLCDRDTALRLFAEQPPVARILHVATVQRPGQRQDESPPELLAINFSLHLHVVEARD